MQRLVLLSIAGWLVCASWARSQQIEVPSTSGSLLTDGFLVSQDAEQKKPDPLKKPPVKVDTPPQVVSEPTPAVSRQDIAERRVSGVPEMLGDVPPAGRLMFLTFRPLVLTPPQQPPNVGGPPQPPQLVPGQPVTVPVGILPGLRSLKVADNGSARPQDRFYFSFNYYDNLNDPVNRTLGSTAHNVRLYRETFGVEKTFFDRRFSIGLRLPLNTLTLDSPLPGVGGNHTAVGDLSIILQGAIFRDEAADNYFTAGIALTPPTGPDTIGNIPVTPGPHTMSIQPFFASLFNMGDFFFQGFTAIDFATGSNDVVLWYNDASLGVFVLRAEEPQFITAIAPAFEVHSSIALNTSNNFGPANPIAYANIVNFGFVGNMEFMGRSRLAIGAVFPVSSPRPFDLEFITQFRFIF